MRSFLALAVLSPILTASCVRGGFTPAGGSEDGRAPSDSRSREPTVTRVETGGAASLDRDNDTCETALVIDAQAALAAPITIALDFTGAKSDYGVGACKDYPELVLQLINTPAVGALTQSCAGGGLLTTYAPQSGCPGLGGGASSSFLTCAPGNFQSLLVPEGGGHLILCRDPANPKLTLTLSKPPK